MRRGLTLTILLLTPLAAHAPADSPQARAEAIRKLLATDLSSKLETAVPLAVITRSNDATAVANMKRIIQGQTTKLKQLDRKLSGIENTMAQMWERLFRLRRQMVNLRTRGKYSQYDRLLPSYNLLVQRYNALIGTFRQQAGQLKFLYLAFLDTSDALEQLDSQEAVTHLEKGAKLNWGIRVRRAFILALGKIAKPSTLALLLELTADRDARVRAMAMRALGGYKDLTSHKDRLLERADGNSEPAWQTRLFLYQLIARWPPQESIPFLVKRIQAERGRIPYAIGRLLAQRTRIKTHDDPSAWVRWFDRHKDAVASGKIPQGLPKTRPGSVPVYHRIEIKSDRIGFVLDLSSSMTIQVDKTEPGQSHTMKRFSLKRTLLGVAKAELINALSQLPTTTVVDVVTYDDFARHLTREPVPMTGSRLDSLIRQIVKSDAGAKTNIYQAFDLSFRRYLDSAGDRAFLDAPDTIFFLTDGKPTRGRIQDKDTLSLCIDRWRLICPVQIHTIALGQSAAEDLLKKLASNSGGQYIETNKTKAEKKD